MPVKDMANAIYASYKAEVMRRGRKLVFDEATKQHIQRAAEWLTDPKGKPGMMLCGLYGNGKTTLMLAICNLVNYLFYSDASDERKAFRIIGAREIARLGSKDETIGEYRRLVNEELLAIDDLGEEPPEIIEYGRIFTPVKDLLLERYNQQRITIATTNLIEVKKTDDKSKKQLTAHYSARVVDRFSEMMDIVIFKNSSYRTKGTIPE